MSDLGAAAREVLGTPGPAHKLRLTHAAAEDWRQGRLAPPAASGPPPPDRPARPAAPALLAPRDMPRRRTGTDSRGRMALLHAIAHIELNAIDLAWDLIARFSAPDKDDLPRAFFDDWVGVADDEARHFALLARRLGELGAAYGDLPAHDGLWQAALDTRHDLLARLAVVPLVLEARGLDVAPQMIERLRRAGDGQSADILGLIQAEEIAHVAAGKRWFDHICRARGAEPAVAFRKLVARHYKGRLKPPFNGPARQAAGLAREFYDPAPEAPAG